MPDLSSGRAMALATIASRYPEARAAVIALPLKAQPVERGASQHFLHGIGELDLAAGAGLLLVQMAEDLRHEYVATDQRQTRRCVLRGRLLDHALGLNRATVILTDVEDAVAIGVILRHFHHRNHIAPGFLVQVDHFLKAGRIALQELIHQQDGKRLVPHQVACAPDGVTKAKRLLLRV